MEEFKGILNQSGLPFIEALLKYEQDWVWTPKGQAAADLLRKISPIC